LATNEKCVGVSDEARNFLLGSSIRGYHTCGRGRASASRGLEFRGWVQTANLLPAEILDLAKTILEGYSRDL